MYILGYLIRTTLIYTIDITITLMFIGAIMSWIAPMSDNRFLVFVRQITSALVYPVRRIMTRFEFARTSPIDLSFTVTLLILYMLQEVLMRL